MALSGAGIVKLADFHIGLDVKADTLVSLLEEFKSGIIEPVYLLYSDRKHLSPASEYLSRSSRTSGGKVPGR
jgi:DNA-binding transcriptional LysR family regulator